MRRVALAALPHYDLPSGTLTFVDHDENTTFRHDSPPAAFCCACTVRSGTGVMPTRHWPSRANWPG
ncbi:MAG TPA: hypothetical protein PKA07_13590 [Micropruina sp.]|nr:hypothetical protein [Micropruina sp.]